uniref:NADH-ubiquinone oxidoreductase chain 2 n=1 Tax=Polychaeta sp. TaxID=3061522 RepID=A0AAU8L3X4_9ANNE
MLFSCTLLTGTTLIFFAPNWFTAWIGLEINLYSFIPIMINSSTTQQKEASMKYFLAQAVGSGLLLIGTLALTSFNSATLMILMALLLKAGVAPFHFWFPSVMSALPWASCILLSTTQKLGPALLIIQMFTPSALILMIISSLSALVGGIGGLNQSQTRAIIAYSSIGHMGWVFGVSIINTPLSKLMLLNYMTTVTSIIILLMMSTSKSSNQPMIPSDLSPLIKTMLVFLFMSLGGLPPFFGFFPKLFIIMELMTNNFIKLSLFLILGSMLNLYYYMKIMYTSFFSMPLKTSMFAKPLMKTTMFITLLMLSSAVIQLSLLITFPWLSS